jgi:hypothetical protein
LERSERSSDSVASRRSATGGSVRRARSLCKLVYVRRDVESSMPGVHARDAVTAPTRDWRTPALLFGLALLVRTGAALQTAVIFNDGPSFLEAAASFRHGELGAALAHHYHPLYPALTGLVAIPLGDLSRAGVAVSVVAGSVAVPALYAFLAWAFDRRTAWLGAALFALQPSAAVLSADVASEGLYLALFLAAVAVLWRAVTEGSAGRAAGAGALAGAAYLVRPEGLGLVVVGLAFGGLRVLRDGASARIFGRLSAALLVGTAVVAGPYLLHLHALTGEWTLTQKKSLSNLIRSAPPPDAPAPGIPDRPRWQPPSSLSLPAPVRSAAPLTARLELEPRSVAALVDLVAVSVSALHPLYAVLVFVGIAGVRGRLGERGVFVILIAGSYAAVLYGLALNVGYLDRRHALAPLLPLLGYAALGLHRLAFLARRLARPRAAPAEPPLALWLAVALVAAVTLPKTLAPHREERLANRRAAEWLLARDDLPGSVAAEKYRTAWYAGRAFVQLSRGGSEGDAVRLAREGAHFLIVDDHQIRARPALVDAASRLVELYRVQAAGRTAFVYDLRGLARRDATERRDPAEGSEPAMRPRAPVP